MNICTLKTVAEIAQATTTTVAIIAGGIWTYFRFVKNRLFFTRAELKHEIVQKNLAAGKSLLRVTLTVFNKGDVLLPISNVWTRLKQITPVTGQLLEDLVSDKDLAKDDEGEILWPEIGFHEIDYSTCEAEIEPGESECFHFDFVINNSVKSVQIYSFFTNKQKKEAGWPLTTIIDI